jgi:cytochrome c biogenesis protein CcmG/thiol:disulfide interchange protein DsbE
MSEKAITSAGAAVTAPSRLIRWNSVILWIAVFGLIGLLGWGLVNASATRPEPGERAPEFDMQYFDGYEWQDRSNAKLSDLKGQVVVLNFWASWCVECKVEAGLLEDTWRRYRDQGVVFVGVTYADVEPNALQYLQDYDITYPNAPDLGTVISADYEITGVPETFFIDKSGVIQHVQIGPVSEPSFSRTIDQLLAQGG